ncbi:ABC transporter permease [Heyndrickxia acidicola]|uniref:ABC transporter permease n=1 Tax=Heyndrickxia acidicola TaxID=209389 RepID=A0ABU6MHB9_9BACI|nr:ABC transporter permease [Heyndrickxia acidicola]MED1202440.1 ABC transporter permease [Heyndrickxia acidicola]
MKKIENLWRERLQLFSQELRRYLKYIFNDHLLFVAIFGIAGGAYYYSQWVKTLDTSFPIGWVMGLILGILLTVSPRFTLLKEADKVFLLPIESKLKGYFKKSLSLSFFIQAYVLLVGLAILMPMYVAATRHGFRSFIYLYFILLAVKYWNLVLQWQVLKYQDSNILLMDGIIRFALNAVLIFFITVDAPLWLAAVVAAVMAGLLVYFYKAGKEKTLNWDRLIELEEKRLMAFYRFANLFTDVPKLKGQVKRRSWLDFSLKFLGYGQTHSFSYLYARTFIRTNAYFGLFARLTIIGAILLYVSDQRYLLIGLSLLFLYLTGFQLIPMVQHHDLKIWVRLYPLNPKLKIESFMKVLRICLLIQAIIFSIVVFVSSTYLNGIYTLVINVIFSFIFVKLYLPGRIRRLVSERI